MGNKTEKESRVPFQVKLLESNYDKAKNESQKLGLTMSAFLSMLIAQYKGVEILIDKEKDHE